MSRTSLNIDAKRVPNKAVLFDALHKLDPPAAVVMDGLGLAKEIKAEFPNCIVAHRAFGESDAYKSMAPRALAERWAHENYGDIATYGINEPVAGGDWSWKRIADWLAESMVEQKKLGLHGLIGNWPPGTIEPADIASGAFNGYLHAEAEHANWHWRGIHDYTGFLLPWGGGWGGRAPEDLLDPVKVQRTNWTTKAEFADVDASYHLGRDRRFDVHARSLGITTQIKKVVSEFGLDRMPDWEKRPTNVYAVATSRYGTSGYHIIRGLNSYAAYYAAMFPGVPFDEVIYWQTLWSEDMYPDEYLALCWYQWTPGTSDWDIAYGFNMSKRTSLYVRIQEGTTPVVDKPTTTPVRARVTSLPGTTTFRNIRAEPVATSADVGDLHVGDEVFYWPPAPVDRWVYVETMDLAIEGWVALASGLVFEVIPEPPPQPPLVSLWLTLPEFEQLVAAQQAELDRMVELRDKLNEVIEARGVQIVIYQTALSRAQTGS